MKWPEPRPAVAACVLAAATLACLLPFLGKAAHMDDPLFIWTARHIQSHPFDFYGFNVNWGYHERPMAENMQNPPLAAYYLSLVGSVIGWSEPALHFGFLLPAVALVLGTYFLSGRFCTHPFAASLGLLAMPVCLLSSTTLMCDTMMAAFWVWSIYLWIAGSERSWQLWVAAALMTLCALTKYFGASLIPLLAVYSVFHQRGTRRWARFFILPIVVLALYQWATARYYGHGLLSNAASYLTTQRFVRGFGTRFLETLAFCGGCTLMGLATLPLLWGRKGFGAGAIGAIASALIILLMKKIGIFAVVENGSVNWPFVLQASLFIVAGATVIALMASDLIHYRTPESLLLAFWITGGLIFAGGLNWTISGRNFLPIAPAVALLVVRRLESRSPGDGTDPFRYFVWPLAISLAVALMVAQADYQLAGSARTAAISIKNQLAARSSGIAFEGHWGFQYYMEQLGAKPLAQKPLVLTSNEAIVIPMGNTCIFDLPSTVVEPFADVEVPASKWLSIQSIPSGAGFYSDDWGPAPFVFNRARPESYWVFRAR
jgi:4-amino-4-deoxy-L-arabinose transferase-like glycosyltransferase